MTPNKRIRHFFICLKDQLKYYLPHESTKLEKVELNVLFHRQQYCINSTTTRVLHVVSHANASINSILTRKEILYFTSHDIIPRPSHSSFYNLSSSSPWEKNIIFTSLPHHETMCCLSTKRQLSLSYTHCNRNRKNDKITR